jgi:amino acid transporter
MESGDVSKSDEGSSNDRRVMSTFRYPQELRRTIRFFGSFAVAFSFISITTGISVNYGLVLGRSGPAGIWTWPIVTIGQTLVALVFAELSARMPLTGYSYQWVTRLAGHGWGWFTGWVAVCFLIIVVPSVDHGIALVIGHILEIENSPNTLKLIVCGVMLAQAIIHIFGVRVANIINSAAVFTEVVGMVGLVVIFAVLAVKNQPSLEILVSTGSSVSDGSYWQAFIMASLMGAYTLVGFESAANLSEETVDAGTTVPRAVILSVLLSGGVGTLFLIFTVLGIHDVASITSAEYPLPVIIENNLGTFAASLFFLLIVVSIFACGLIIMASGSRLIYAMARDRVFPASPLFSRVSARTSVPVPALLLILVLGIIVEVFAESLEQLLLAAAVLPALIYLLTVASYALRRDRLQASFGTFSLGKWGDVVAKLAIGWLLLVIGVLTLPEEFRSATLISGALCALGIAIYFARIRGKILRGEAGIRAAADNDETGVA